ncbi:MAG: DUF342 domain-containing protein [Lachnospira sp.]
MEDILEKLEQPDNDRRINVVISDNHMSATLELGVVEDEYSFDEVMDEISKAGVKTGIDEEAVRDILANKLYGQRRLIASGRAAENGADGYYEFFFDENCSDYNKPTVREDGSVDYFNVKLFQKVNKDDKLVEYYEPTKGNFGYDVCGKLIVPKPGKSMPKLRGKGFRISEDGKEYFASIDGKVEYRNFDLNISSVYDVDGDVDLSVGNIDFNGDVSISGGVRGGVTIHAMGNIFIGGFVEGANLKAGKDIILQDGVNAKGVGKIEAEGNISARFFENCNVFAKGDVKCDYMLNTTALAFGKIYLEGKLGSVIGGDITGVMGIDTISCGNETCSKTVLRVGSTKEIRGEYAKNIMRLKELDTQIETFDEALVKFAALKEAGSDKYSQEMSTRVLQSKIVKKAEKSKFEEESRQLYSIIRDSEHAVVRVSKNIYPGSRVVMDDRTYVPSSVFTHVLVKKTASAIVLRDYDDEY